MWAWKNKIKNITYFLKIEKRRAHKSQVFLDEPELREKSFWRCHPSRTSQAYGTRCSQTRGRGHSTAPSTGLTEQGWISSAHRRPPSIPRRGGGDKKPFNIRARSCWRITTWCQLRLLPERPLIKCCKSARQISLILKQGIQVKCISLK